MKHSLAMQLARDWFTDLEEDLIEGLHGQAKDSEAMEHYCNFWLTKIFTCKAHCLQPTEGDMVITLDSDVE
jgi:hypothetical protein